MYLLLAFFATVGTWLLTAMGSSAVLFFKKCSVRLLNIMLGFSSGIMLAASYWSLLAPALEVSDTCFPVIIGFLSGGFFLLLSDAVITHFNTDNKKRRSFLLVSSITLHNIPEGLAVGVAFGALKGMPLTPALLASPIAIALGIGLQNFPEGAAVSLPLLRDGHSRLSAFMIGQLSGIVEPVFGVLGALLVALVTPLMPYALSFAAGAMIFVVCKELIPEAESCEDALPSVGCMLGFALMMLLDVTL